MTKKVRSQKSEAGGAEGHLPFQRGKICKIIC